MVFYFLCSDCDLYTHKCTKGARRRVLRGEPVACRPCQTLLLERYAIWRQQAWQAKKEREEYRRREEECLEQASRLEFESRALSADVVPWHPDQGRDVIPAATLHISSGGICFGANPTDIQLASYQPLRLVQTAMDDELHAPAAAAQRTSHHSNLAVRNGQWNVYKIDTKVKRDGLEKPIYATNTTVALLICFEEHDPVQECRYLLYHSVDPKYGGGAVYGYGKSNGKICHQVGILKQSHHNHNSKQESEDKETIDREVCRVGFHIAEYENIDNSVSTDLKGTTELSSLSITHGRIHVDDCLGVRSFLIYGDDVSLGDAYFAGLYPNGPPARIKYPLGFKDENGAWREYDPFTDTPQFHDPKQRRITDFFRTIRG